MKLISIVAMLFLIAWVVNFVKITDCDFKSDYKCEAIHGVGIIIMPASLITVWFDTDD